LAGVATQDPDTVKALLTGFSRSWAGTTSSEFEGQVLKWLTTVRQPTLGELYKDLVCQHRGRVGGALVVMVLNSAEAANGERLWRVTSTLRHNSTTFSVGDIRGEGRARALTARLTGWLGDPNSAPVDDAGDRGNQ